MKTALAIVCSLVLAWTSLVQSQASEASVAGAAHSCCHCGGAKCCCAANHSIPEPPPVSTAPVSSSLTQFSPLAPSALAWTLPETLAHEISSPLFSPSTTAGTALLARNCAWLI